ncbi:glycosyl amidation-associated protein WbuZ [Clostridium magnum]|uniref:Imidazole glycerol phosphate synthase subunit HisF n=1 Tax=Clostridium magnum DSM 2767 TaxID=1121326 RepID=A0A161Y6W2_9CLOT|nr:glycosyl amidation-associated protein WbuZ [Clostridium magnum]KZL94089.1 imidazole glycerol phosphate synthase subunit HisF [Clostridium magnum DSM 2767]SHH95195.1 cyclase [Clostridium magnum DSM 2767]
MLKKRIIPSLLLKDGRMVKGKNFDNFRDVGNPITAAKVYNAQKVDELIFLDICPSAESREKVYDVIKEVATECFMPLTVGGGIKNCDDIKAFLDIGADKVSINSSAIRYPSLIRQASETFGDQCVVVSIDYKKNIEGKLEVFIDSGKTPTGISPFEHILNCISLGAGEILLTNIDNEGTMQGYDIEFIKYVSENTNIPIIASGGAGTLEHFYNILKETNASAVSAGSIFHFTDQSPIKARFYLSNSGINIRV